VIVGVGDDGVVTVGDVNGVSAGVGSAAGIEHPAPVDDAVCFDYLAIRIKKCAFNKFGPKIPMNQSR
jgi:hypothetical protein